MRFLTADYLFPLYRNPIKEGVLQISDEGKVIDIIDHRSKIDFKKLEISICHVSGQNLGP